MRCARARDHFHDLLDHRLGEAERRRVQDHLAACPECSAEYDWMQRAVQGLRDFPRPPAPVLEVSLPAGGVAPGMAFAPRRFRPLRAAAAILLFAALGATHFLAFYFGERKNEDLAEIGARELPRLITDHLDNTDRHVRYAQVVAENNPQDYTRLVSNNPGTRDLMARTRTLFRVSDHPAIQQGRERLLSYRNDLEDMNEAQEPGKSIIYRLKKDGHDLQRLFAQDQVRSRRRDPSVKDSAAVVREAYRRLFRGDYIGTNQIVVDLLKQNPHPEFPNVFLFFMAESDIHLGELKAPRMLGELARKARSGPRIFMDSLEAFKRSSGSVRSYTFQINSEVGLNSLIQIAPLRTQGTQIHIRTNLGPFPINLVPGMERPGIKDILRRILILDFMGPDGRIR